jgi:hypothetical protein
MLIEIDLVIEELRRQRVGFEREIDALRWWKMDPADPVGIPYGRTPVAKEEELYLTLRHRLLYLLSLSPFIAFLYLKFYTF